MKDNPLLKNAELLAANIESLCKSLEHTGNSNIIFQIKKSSSSVFANITEAQYPQSLPDMLSKFKIARKDIAKELKSSQSEILWCTVFRSTVCYNTYRAVIM